jgi:hypothetical protein
MEYRETDLNMVWLIEYDVGEEGVGEYNMVWVNIIVMTCDIERGQNWGDWTD